MPNFHQEKKNYIKIVGLNLAFLLLKSVSLIVLEFLLAQCYFLSFDSLFKYKSVIFFLFLAFMTLLQLCDDNAFISASWVRHLPLLRVRLLFPVGLQVPWRQHGLNCTRLVLLFILFSVSSACFCMEITWHKWEFVIWTCFWNSQTTIVLRFVSFVRNCLQIFRTEFFIWNWVAIRLKRVCHDLENMPGQSRLKSRSGKLWLLKKNEQQEKQELLPRLHAKKIPKNPSLKNEQFEKSDSYARVEKPLTACKWVVHSPSEQKKIKLFQS